MVKIPRAWGESGRCGGTTYTYPSRPNRHTQKRPSATRTRARLVRPVRRAVAVVVVDARGREARKTAGPGAARRLVWGGGTTGRGGRGQETGQGDGDEEGDADAHEEGPEKVFGVSEDRSHIIVLLSSLANFGIKKRVLAN